MGTGVYLSLAQPDYLEAGALVVVFLEDVAVVVDFLGAVDVVFLEAEVVVDFVAGLVEEACALAPSVIRAAAKTSARFLKLFIALFF